MIWSIEVPDDVQYVDNQVFFCLGGFSNKLEYNDPREAGWNLIWLTREVFVGKNSLLRLF